MVQYYVNPVSGNNANPGTQESAPFKTIAHALQQVRTGDRIQLASGTYSAASGEQFPLRIINGVTVIGNEAQKGKGILIEGGGASYPSPLMEGYKPNVTIWLEDNNIQLLGITATNPNSKGIGVWVESPVQIVPTVKSCTFTGCGKDEKDKEGVGIAIVGGASPKISDNVIKLNKGCGLTVRPGIIASEIARPVLLNNTIEQNFQDGLLVSGQCQPILGTSEKPGGNLLRGNCGYDLQNSGTATLSLVGNQIDPARVTGKVNIDKEKNTVPAPLPCPKDPSAYTLSGRVSDRATHQPIANLKVQATFSDGTQTILTRTSNTSASGDFFLPFDRSLFQGGRKIRVSFQVYLADKPLPTEAAIDNLQPANQQIEIEVTLPDEQFIRTQFTKLVLGNPNYFGNMPELGFQPVEIMSGNTAYEELTCIGLNPEADRLEAAVKIKQHYGYNTDACGVGSPEYVRFFVERSDGWHDVGIVSFTSYNIPGGDLPLSYSVGIGLSEIRKYCNIENLVKVRGILSWNQEPPAGNPNWKPPWGNVLDLTVQIAALPLLQISIGQLIADKFLTLDDVFLENLDLHQTLQPAVPQAKSYAKLKEMYVSKDVPKHRFGFKEAIKLTQAPLTSKVFSPQPPSEQTRAATQPVFKTEQLLAGPELGEILESLQIISGDTNYEELTCVGYNPDTRTLGGVISIKRSSGYSGGLCSLGSTEYVGFWVFYGGAWQSLGGAQVQVHDLTSISGGKTVQYAVFRVINLPEYLCQDVTGLKLRAILSWEVPPTSAGFIPTWGNVLNTYIQPPIGQPDDGDKRHVRLQRIGRVTINGITNDINITGTGRANNPAPIFVSGDCQGNDSPFGGTIYVEGDFTKKLDVFDADTGDVLPGIHPLKYQVFVKKVGSSTETQLTNSFTIAVFPKNGYLPVVKTQSVEAGYYTYMESNDQAVSRRVLAVWQAGGLEEGLYYLELRGFAWDASSSSYVLADVQGRKVYIYNGYPHVELLPKDSSATFLRPEVHLAITSPGGDCGNFEVGSVIKGTYSVSDKFFGRLGVSVVPITVGGVLYIYPGTIPPGGTIPPSDTIPPSPPPPGLPNPIEFGQTPEADTNGISGEWQLNTKGMTPCGYTIQLWSWDRALANDSCVGHYNETGVGFCLRPKPM